MTREQYNGLDEFTKGYLKAACWTSDERPGSGEYPEERALELLAHVPPEVTDEAVRDCRKFGKVYEEIYVASNASKAGTHFWLTRNQHGAGFWDGDWPERDGEELTRAADLMGEADDTEYREASNEADATAIEERLEHAAEGLAPNEWDAWLTRLHDISPVLATYEAMHVDNDDGTLEDDGFNPVHGDWAGHALRVWRHMLREGIDTPWKAQDFWRKNKAETDDPEPGEPGSWQDAEDRQNEATGHCDDEREQP